MSQCSAQTFGNDRNLLCFIRESNAGKKPSSFCSELLCRDQRLRMSTVSRRIGLKRTFIASERQNVRDCQPNHLLKCIHNFETIRIGTSPVLCHRIFRNISVYTCYNGARRPIVRRRKRNNDSSYGSCSKLLLSSPYNRNPLWTTRGVTLGERSSFR